MSAAKPETKPTPPRNLTEALFSKMPAATPPEQLSQIESRLVRLTGELLPGVVLQVRCDAWDAVGGPSVTPMLPRITLDQIVTAHRIALACAIEIEKPLRELRDKIEGKS